VDGVLRFLALEVALVNGDGYWARASDYSIYQDETGRFHMIPHDINEALMAEGGGGGRGGFGGGGGVRLDPLTGLNDSSKPLRSRLLAVPALREKYLGYVREIAGNWLNWENVESLLAGYRELIGPDVERDTRKLYSTEAFHTDYDGGEGSLRGFIEARGAYLRSALP
jgi:hypothetical protein